MSGHSKWNNIKNKKGKTDAQRGKIFTKIGREIAIAVKEGGSDPSTNSKLRDVISKAKSNNMPNDNIDRSIKKASGELGSVNYEEIVYEGYGCDGVAVIVEVVTDNKNRTAGEMRYIFDRNGGSMGATGCVSWMFDRVGVVYIEDDGTLDGDELMMNALEFGANDIDQDEGTYRVLCDVSNLTIVREHLEAAGYKVGLAEIDRIPQNTVEPKEKLINTIVSLIEKFEDHDDVQNVYHNAILPEDDE